jgi:hypothetical protein
MRMKTLYFAVILSANVIPLEAQGHEMDGDGPEWH